VPKLVVTDGDNTYLIDIGLEESLVIGRSHDCDIPISAPRASRRHATIVGDGGRHRVADLGSTNGTLLNGAPFAGEAPLKDRDVVDAGGCLVVYRADPP
jgi:pSer/pThr/pTyr-binding forkhead associated (FHA) protein